MQDCGPARPPEFSPYTGPTMAPPEFDPDGAETVSRVDRIFDRYLDEERPEDLAAVFDAAAPELLGIARAARLDDSAAEDALQETFLAVVRRRATFRRGSAFMPWAAGIMARQVRAARRRRAELARTLGLTEDIGIEAAELPGPGGTPEGAATRRETRAEIERALGSVSETNRAVVRSALFEGLGSRELAAKFGLSAGAASVRLHRGLKQLRGRLSFGALALAAALLRPGPRGHDAVRASVVDAARRAPGKVAWATPGALAGIVACGALTVVAATLLLRTGEPPAEHVEPGDSLVHADEREATPRTERTTVQPDSKDGRRTPAVDLALAGKAPPASGVVLRADGRHAGAGVELFALETTPDIVLPTEPLVPFATTDENGRYAVPRSLSAVDPTPLIVARQPRATIGGSSGEQGWAPLSEDAAAAPSIQMRPELRVNATVVDAEGAPVVGARVAALPLIARFLAISDESMLSRGYLPVRPHEHLFGATTDEHGRATIGALPADQVVGTVAIVGAWKAGRTNAMGLAQWVSEGEVNADVRLVLPTLASRELHGSVRDETGAPIAGAEVRALFRGEAPSSDESLCSSDAGGNWSLPETFLDEYPMLLTFEREGYAPRKLEVTHATQADGEPRNIVLVAATPISGRVLSAAGAPAAGADITVVSSAAVRSTSSDAEGRFVFPGVAEGPVTLYVRFGGLRVRVPVDAQRSGLQVELPSVEAAIRELRVELHDAVTEEVLASEKASLVAARVPGFVGEWPAVEIADGAIRATDLPPGDWTVFASAGIGKPVFETLTVEGSTDEVVDRAIAVHGIGSIECLIELPEGASTEGALIVASRAGRHGEPPFWFKLGDGVTRTEIVVPVIPGGATTIDSVASGAWRLSAHGSGWGTPVHTVTVASGETARVDFEVGPSGTVAVAIPDLVRPGRLEFDVRALSGVASETWDTRARFECFRASDGPFDIALPAGEYEWRARLIGYSDAGENIDLFPRTRGSIAVEGGGVYRVDVEDVARGD